MEGWEEAARMVIVEMWRAGAQSLRDQQRLEWRQAEDQAPAKGHLAAQTTEVERQTLERSYYEALEVPPTANRRRHSQGCAAYRQSIPGCR